MIDDLRFTIYALLGLSLGAAVSPPLPKSPLPPSPSKGAVRLVEMLNVVKAQKLAALVVPAPKTFVLTFDGGLGGGAWYYSLQAAPGAAGPWREIGHLPPTNNGAYYFTNVAPAGAEFYRVGRIGP